jgi:CBS-domain-containing membrane protein
MAKYQPLEIKNISSEHIHLKTHHLPEIIHFDDPAFIAMVDFRNQAPHTLPETTELEAAQHEMEFHGTHFMLVTNSADKLIGVVTASDLLGEKPIQVASHTRIAHDKIQLSHLMTSIEKIPALDVEAVSYAKVANIIKTLHSINSPYALVIRQLDDGTQRLRGYFSTSQMSKQLHQNVRKGAIDIDQV